MHGERPPEHVRRLAILTEREVTEPLTRQRPEVDGVSAHDLLAFGQLAVELAHQVVRGRALVPSLREPGL